MSEWSSQQVVDALGEVWASVLEATEGLDEALWSLGTACPGWSVADQVSHLVGTERSLLGESAPEVEIGDRPYIKNALGELIERWLEVRRSLPGDEIRSEFAEVTAKRLEVLRSLPESAFDEIGWSPVGKVPMRTFMIIRVMDCWIHEQDIRLALGRPGGRNGLGEQMSLERADAALGGVIGKGATAPEGSSVVIDVTGPLGGRHRIEVVDGRAVPCEGDDATVVITMSQETYVRRFGGRITAEEALDDPDTSVAGDEALGHAVLGALGVMI